MAADSRLIVSVSGIRGIVGESLTPDAANSFALALGTYSERGSIVVSIDGRPSGDMLRHAVMAGLLASGCDVFDLDVAPTPTVGIAVTELQAAGAIQITASHNPAPWNGLKLFGADGRVLSADEGKQIQQIFASKQFRLMPWNELGTERSCAQALDWHQGKVLGLIDREKIRQRRLTVFLDANGGAGGSLGLSLLESLQCKVIAQACDADGIFVHGPEPIAENLQSICPQVQQFGADIGLVLDPDADRLALIDETGRYIGEELTLALAVFFRLGQQQGPVVINMSTSRIVEDICKQFGVECDRAAVGEANVVDKMQHVGAVIGGEGNGGVIDPRVGLVRDPFIAAGLILELMAETGRTLSELVNALPSYSIVKMKYGIERDRLPQWFADLQSRWPEARVNQLDGLRLDWEDRWVHVRPSNTEPIVRVIAEAPTSAVAEQLCQEAGKLLPQ